MSTQVIDPAGLDISESISVLVHVGGRNVVSVDARANDSLSDVLARAGIGSDEEVVVFIGECEDARAEAPEVEDGEDGHQPVTERTHPLKHYGVHHGHHIHCHRCHRIRIDVSYNGADKHHRFSPAATIDTVRYWALNKFKISAVDGETLVLTISGVEKPPLPDTHLGDLVTHHHCALALELVPDHRING